MQMSEVSLKKLMKTTGHLHTLTHIGNTPPPTPGLHPPTQPLYHSSVFPFHPLPHHPLSRVARFYDIDIAQADDFCYIPKHHIYDAQVCQQSSARALHLPHPAIPLPAIPLPAIPLPTIPLPAIPLPAIPLPTIPLHAIPLPAISLPAIPLPAIPLPAIPLPAHLHCSHYFLAPAKGSFRFCWSTVRGGERSQFYDTIFNIQLPVYIFQITQ